MEMYSACIQIGNRLYNVILAEDQLFDINKRGMSSEVVQELLLNQDFSVTGPDVPTLNWKTTIIYKFGLKADGVSCIFISILKVHFTP